VTWTLSVATRRLTAAASTMDGPAGTLYGPGATGLLRSFTDSAMSRTMGRATTSRTTGRATRSADYCAIVPLDLLAGGQQMLIHVHGHRAPVTWSLQLESRAESAAYFTTTDRTWQTGAYIPLDLTTRTATAAWTGLDQQPLAQQRV
jgi:hypothetical protein